MDIPRQGRGTRRTLPKEEDSQEKLGPCISPAIHWVFWLQGISLTCARGGSLACFRPFLAQRPLDPSLVSPSFCLRLVSPSLSLYAILVSLSVSPSLSLSPSRPLSISSSLSLVLSLSLYVIPVCLSPSLPLSLSADFSPYLPLSLCLSVFPCVADRSLYGSLSGAL